MAGRGARGGAANGGAGCAWLGGQWQGWGEGRFEGARGEQYNKARPGRAMAHPLRKLLEEALCPICLEYFNDPVCMDCGHNFCRFCITEYYEKLEIEEEGVFCPQCRSKLKKEKSQTNRQLARMVENIQQLGIKPEDLKKQTVCREHEDKLKLFCEDDGEVICLLCDKTQEHGSHTLVPIEDAAQEYKVKLHNDIECLKKAREEISKLKSKEQNKPKDWKERVKCQRQRISSEFEKLQLLLNEEKKLFLQGLAEEERETLKKLNENVTKLSQQSFSLQQLITEMEKKCQQPAAELLQDVKGTLARSGQVRLQEPELSAAELKDVYGVPGIMEVLREFTGNNMWFSYGVIQPQLTKCFTKEKVFIVPEGELRHRSDQSQEQN
ncbi:laminin subunit beta-4 [Platysternon megacephalum]|uniref:Laminin subunit beta-4 n=1 Tax=Platysternon megacephalum TaxID=55544 RepID=A0A4D9DH52_9SAUR|nr:laminin subunit beta-4 [Platysternon megacephalum]